MYVTYHLSNSTKRGDMKCDPIHVYASFFAELSCCSDKTHPKECAMFQALAEKQMLYDAN